MYDNLKSEISEFKLKAAERADKADYYRKTLENERQSREQADKQVLDLLHDVRNRYDTKLNSYMAKNKGNLDDAKQNCGAKSSPGSTNNNNVSDAGNKKSKKNKGSPKDKTDTGNRDSWDIDDNQSPSKKNDDDAGWGNSNNQSTGWGDDDKHDNSNDQNTGWGNSDNQNTDWVNSDDKDNGWGNSNDQNTGWADDGNHDKSNDKDANNKKEENWNDDNATGWGNEPASNNQETNENEKSKDATGSTNNNSNKSNVGNNKKNKKNKGAAKTVDDSSNQDTRPKASEEASCKDNSSKKGGDTDKRQNIKISADQEEAGSKEYLEIKSQLWSAKLDLRLAERDKSKLREELDNVRTERDDLIRKLKHVNAEQDTLKVRLRGVTVDLVSANDEIHKLNERLDEIEAEKRSKERDLTLDETRRRAMESKTKSFQQQIANLQSDITSLKEVREDLEKQVITLTRRNERLENDLDHSKKLIRTLKDGCAMVEGQAKTFEVRHDTVMMSKADMERELIAIKEESSRHITTINKLQKSNEQISKAFLMSVEAHEQCKDELEKLSREYARRQQALEVENLRVVEANNQLRKLIDFLQKR